MLTDEQVAAFVDNGFVHVVDAFPRAVADEGRAILWSVMGLSPDDPATWTRPMVRIDGRGDQPFGQAANSPRLREAFDQLVGPGRWAERTGLGTFPIRFPHAEDPGDTGWHMDGSYLPAGESWYWLNLRSRGRALLMLFLFSDVGPDDAPTRIKVGSHLDVPAFLAAASETGRNAFELCREMDAAGRLDAADRPTALATGRAGDVYLCHPFLIHAAQANPRTPRFLAQPPLGPAGLLDLDRADCAYSPVEIAVRRGLDQTTGQPDRPTRAPRSA